MHKSLNIKGIHEKHLADMIASFVKEEIIVEKVSVESGEEVGRETEPYLVGIYERVERGNVIGLVLELE